MKLTIEATGQIVSVDGVECRVWNATTEAGIRCYVLVHRVAVRSDLDSIEFERELLERMPPASAVL